MTNQFIQDLAQRVQLTDQEIAVLDAAGVRTPEDIDSLVKMFPSLGNAGIRLPDISSAVTEQLNSSYASLASNTDVTQVELPLGALPPSETEIPIGLEVPMPAALGSGAGASVDAPASPTTTADVRLRTLIEAALAECLADNPWPVRNQQNRGTCVAFGSTACMEHLCAMQSSDHTVTDLSEQFLYWAIKDHSNDPVKTSDGTWLEYARDMLRTDGICTEDLWSYVGSPVNPVSGQTGSDPSDAAKSDAGNREVSATCYQRNPTGAAAIVCQLLQNNRPVAVCLPVFKDPLVPQHGWGTPVAMAYGRILNPPPTSSVFGGHCVCVTGYVADASEPTGGYFIFRNSWGTGWASQAPAAGYYSPEQGYGEISATYVDKYCWEIMQL